MAIDKNNSKILKTHYNYYYRSYIHIYIYIYVCVCIWVCGSFSVQVIQLLSAIMVELLAHLLGDKSCMTQNSNALPPVEPIRRSTITMCTNTILCICTWVLLLFYGSIDLMVNIFLLTCGSYKIDGDNKFNFCFVFINRKGRLEFSL